MDLKDATANIWRQFCRTSRCPFSFGLIVLAASLTWGQGPGKLAKRFGFDANTDAYPQATPKDTIESLVKAFDNRRVDYLLAQLADPRFVDETVASYKTAIRQGDDKSRLFLAFDRLVTETTQYFLDDPTLVKELRRFAKEAEWQGNDAETVGTLRSVQGRKVFLRKIEARWFLENRQQ